nr:gibberellin 2-beta-dioxygenase 8 [Ipomoea batatas]
MDFLGLNLEWVETLEYPGKKLHLHAAVMMAFSAVVICLAKKQNESIEPDYESYPPLFRPSSVNQNHGGVEKESPEMEAAEGDGVPIIDFERMKEDEEKVKEACREWGFFRLVNHGIPESLMSQMLESARELFSMAYEAKQAAFNSGAGISYFLGTAGLTQSGAALASGNLNWMEGLNIPLSKVSELHYEDPMLQSFRSLVEEYGKHQTRVGKAIYEALWRKLEFGTSNLSKYEEWAKYFSEDTGILRVYRYPRCLEANRAWGVEEHTDSSRTPLNIAPRSCWRASSLQGSSMDPSQPYPQHPHCQHWRYDPGDDVVIESSKYKPFTYAQFRAQVQHELKSVGFKIGLNNFKRP